MSIVMPLLTLLYLLTSTWTGVNLMQFYIKFLCGFCRLACNSKFFHCILKNWYRLPNLAKNCLSSLFTSERHTEANVSKSWILENPFHESCCWGHTFCIFYRHLENSHISAFAKKKIIKNWLVRVYGSPQAFREIPVRNNTYSELQLKK